MPTDIRPGMRVRVTRGMHAGAEGRVVRLSAGGTWATLDVGEAQPIAAYVSALEPIAETPTLRDRVKAVLEAVRTQRDREAELAEALPDDDAVTHEYAHALLEETIAALTQALEEGS